MLIRPRSWIFRELGGIGFNSAVIVPRGPRVRSYATVYLSIVDQMNALSDDLSGMVAEERDDVVDGRVVRQSAHAHTVASLAGRYQLRRQSRHHAVERRKSQQRELGARSRSSITTRIHVAIQHLQGGPKKWRDPIVFILMLFITQNMQENSSIVVFMIFYKQTTTYNRTVFTVIILNILRYACRNYDKSLSSTTVLKWLLFKKMITI